MRNLCWVLIVLAAAAFVVGTATAFTHRDFLLAPVGFWRGAVGFLLFAIALRMMDARDR
jgi:predicted outer membrane lipoprotein